MVFTESLRKNFEFKKVYDRGKSFADKFLVMYVLKNSSHKNRLGVSISKKVGKSVCRNRISRLIKENYHLNENLFLCGFDIVFIARNPSNEADFYTMRHRWGPGVPVVAM